MASTWRWVPGRCWHRRAPCECSGTPRHRPDARHLFQRCGPIWLTFAAAHAAAAVRDRPEDWWALAWLRGTEVATDVVWARSPAVSRPGAKLALRLAGAFNLAAAVGFGALARWRERGAAQEYPAGGSA